jgi:hypothetical protein
MKAPGKPSPVSSVTAPEKVCEELLKAKIKANSNNKCRGIIPARCNI